MGQRIASSTPPVNLNRLHKCHYDHNELENHITAPGHSEVLAETTGHQEQQLVVRKHSRHDLKSLNEGGYYPKLGSTHWSHERFF